MPEFILDPGSPDGARAFAALDLFTRGYVEALFFTSTGCAEDEELEHASVAELAPETLNTIQAECDAFQTANRADIDEATDNGRINGYDDASSGRDFWFTRCGHGVGFWDRGLGDVGDKLSDAARKAGERYLYRGDDGHLYVA